MAFRQLYPLDHATHIPIMIGIAKTFPSIQSVIEYGAGFYSTPLFLDRRIFPNLKSLISIEPVEIWAQQVLLACKDERLNILPGEIVPTPKTDLIFIDSGRVEEEREATIAHVAPGFSGITAIHDSERYQEAIKNLWSYRFDFTSFLPNTSVGSNGRVLPIRWIQNVLDKYWEKIGPDDVGGWLQAYAGERLP